MLTGAASIRDVVPFPKNQRAQDLLVGAPAAVGSERLRELGLALSTDGTTR